MCRLACTSRHGSAAWLTAPPTHQCSILTDFDYKVAVNLRLGLQWRARQACACHPSVTRMPAHPLTCAATGNDVNIWRHNLVRDGLGFWGAAAGLSVRIEPMGLGAGKLHPDMEIFINGKCVLVGVSVANPAPPTGCLPLGRRATALPMPRSPAVCRWPAHTRGHVHSVHHRRLSWGSW